MTEASGGAPGEHVSLARTFVLGLEAGLALVVGALFIYGFGAGYFENFSIGLR
jgi:hypothetical protein